jgi:hypothetical protein
VIAVDSIVCSLPDELQPDIVGVTYVDKLSSSGGFDVGRIYFLRRKCRVKMSAELRPVLSGIGLSETTCVLS